MTESDTLEWLLQPSNPSARYLALVYLLGRPADDPEVTKVREAISTWGPAKDILDAQWPDGYWMRPGVGYSPKHKATVWQVIFLAWLGAPLTPAIDSACLHILDHSRLSDGRFSEYKTDKGAVLCLNGNLLRAMLQLGFTNAWVDESLEALAFMVRRSGYRCRYNASSPKPVHMRDGQPCAWGTIKVLGALAEVPDRQRSTNMAAAVQQGLDLLLGPDLFSGAYPTPTRASPLWHRFGFPLGYTSDLLEALDVLLHLGFRGDPRLRTSIDFVLSQRDATGRWSLDHTPKNTWSTFGSVGEPSKWVTLRALRALKRWRAGSPDKVSCENAGNPSPVLKDVREDPR
ncbi:hypothetical protein ACFLWA_06380 [Chloroflexota bacterium]